MCRRLRVSGQLFVRSAYVMFLPRMTKEFSARNCSCEQRKIMNDSALALYTWLDLLMYLFCMHYVCSRRLHRALCSVWWFQQNMSLRMYNENDAMHRCSSQEQTCLKWYGNANARVYKHAQSTHLHKAHKAFLQITKGGFDWDQKDFSFEEHIGSSYEASISYFSSYYNMLRTVVYWQCVLEACCPNFSTFHITNK